MPSSSEQNPPRMIPGSRIDRPAKTRQSTPGVQTPLAPSEAGVIVLSSSTRMLHMNGRARTLMSLFGEAHELWPHLAPESMPSILEEFCRDVFTQLRHRIEARDWAQFEMRRICHMVTPPLLLRGFGVPNSMNQEPRMILTLQAISADA